MKMRYICTLLLGLVVCLSSVAQDGTVIVYRPSKFVGSALKPSVYVDGSQVARLENGRYISLQLAAGKHSFESSMKKTSPLEVEVKSTETVYLEMVILTGNWRGGGRLIPVTEDDAKTALVKLKPSDEKQVVTRETSIVQAAQSDVPSADNSEAQPLANSGSPTPLASVTIKSTPLGADITVDGKFMGNTPSTIQLRSGEHEVLIEKEGLRPWQRTMTVSAGGNLNIDANLEKP
jgi:PEGA domain/Protein of unknown function (DUF2846)